MALNNSGPISLGGSTSGQSIALEIGQSATAQISLNDANVRTLAGVASGAIIMPTNFYGKSSGNYNFTSFEFTNCYQTGALGPNYGTCLSSYDTFTNPWLLDTNFFNVIVDGIQLWTVPATAAYNIEVWGAAGGSNGWGDGGYGARIKTQIGLTAGQKVSIVVGQEGEDGSGATLFNSGPGGGGGSFVYINDTLLVAAGGGGGALTSETNLITSQYDANGKATTGGGSIPDAGGYFAQGGINGYGGGVSNRGILYGGSGAGWLSSGGSELYQGGQTRAGGIGLNNNWIGGGSGYSFPGSPGRKGGFGGGGASYDVTGYVYLYSWGGGGGGYSGGAGGHNGGQSDGQYGGGGGSYYTGSLILAQQGFNNGPGRVIITKV